MIAVQHAGKAAGLALYEDFHLNPNSFTFILISYGRAVFWMDHQKKIVKKGDVLLLPPAVNGYSKSIPTVLHEKYTVSFKVSDSLAAKLSILQETSCIHRKIKSYELVLKRLNDLITQWQERESYYDTLCQAILLEILVIVNREWDRKADSPETIRQINLMKNYIRSHYRNKITKETLAATIGKSPNYTATLFRRMTGQTISEYVHEVRINQALYLLKESQLTVKEIAEVLGYNDVTYFHKIFKRITGKTPAAFSKERARIL